MDKEPLVSIILPIYNECGFLQKAIESIICQKYSNIEIIIVNDGSTNPEVEKICHKYIDKIVYLKKENGGVASALNFGIDAAKGDYIARMDGDDISYPERICKQVEFLENNKDIDICGTNYDYINNNDMVISSSKLPIDDCEIKTQNIFQNSLCHPSIMFRRRVFDNNLRYDINVSAEDYELWLRLEDKVKFANLKECLIGYRCNALGVTKIHSEEINLYVAMLVKQHLNIIMDNAFESRDEYSFGSVSFIINHTKKILSFLREQLYIYTTILKWNESSGFYNSMYLRKTISERWIECLKLSGMRNFLENENRKEFLEVQYFIDNPSECEKLYKIISDEIKAQLELVKVRKCYLIYSIGARGQAVYSALLALKNQQKIQWDMVGFGDKTEKTEKFFSYPVYSINRIENIEFDYVIIATNKYFDEIKAELIDRGIEQNQILDSNWIQWIKMYTD